MLKYGLYGISFFSGILLSYLYCNRNQKKENRNNVPIEKPVIDVDSY